MVSSAAPISAGWDDSDFCRNCALPANCVFTVSGMRSPAAVRSTMAVASPSARPGARLKLMLAAGNWPWWRTASAVVPRSKCATADSGTCTAFGAPT